MLRRVSRRQKSSMGRIFMRGLSILTAVALAAVAFDVGGHVMNQGANTSRTKPSAFSSLRATYVTSRSIEVAPDEQVGGAAICPSGQIAIGGGGYGSSASPLQSIDASIPRKSLGSSVPNQWAAWFNNGTARTNSFVVYAVCIQGSANVSTSFIQH